jgi:hypothetical protein
MIMSRSKTHMQSRAVILRAGMEQNSYTKIKIYVCKYIYLFMISDNFVFETNKQKLLKVPEVAPLCLHFIIGL